MKTNRNIFVLLLGLLLLAGCASPKITSPTPLAQPSQNTFTGQPTSSPALSTALTPVSGEPAGATPASTPTQGAQVEAQPTPAPTEQPTLPADQPANSQPTPASQAASPTTEPEASPSAPTETAVNPVETSAQPGETCKESAAFYGDVTIPDGTFFRAGDGFTKTWRFRNNGECTWNSSYSVVFAGGENMNAPLSIPFPATVPPGGQVDVSIDMQAPGRGGSHTGSWEFVDPQGRRFGTGSTAKETFWVTIAVSFVDDQGVAIPIPTSSNNSTIIGAARNGAANTGAANTGQTSAAEIPLGCPGQQNRDYEVQVIGMINQARSLNGLPALRENNQLDAAAQAHSGDMACNNYLNHTGSDGSTWYDRIRAQGYAYSSATENIYAGDPGYGGDPQGAMQWWLNSQVHRDNILSSNVSEVGVGYVSNSQSQYGGYFTVVFARP